MLYAALCSLQCAMLHGLRRALCSVLVRCCMLHAAHRTCVIICILFFGLWPRVVCNMQHTMRHSLYHLFSWLVWYGGTQNMRHNLYPLFWFVAPNGMQHTMRHDLYHLFCQRVSLYDDILSKRGDR